MVYKNNWLRTYADTVAICPSQSALRLKRINQLKMADTGYFISDCFYQIHAKNTV
jgi:hypothetical protein